MKPCSQIIQSATIPGQKRVNPTSAETSILKDQYLLLVQ